MDLEKGLIVTIAIQGEGINIGPKEFALNPFGPTHYRIEEESNAPIGEWVFDAVNDYGKVSLGIHTHDSQGKRAEIIALDGLVAGAEGNHEVSLLKDGKSIPLKVAIQIKE